MDGMLLKGAKHGQVSKGLANRPSPKVVGVCQMSKIQDEFFNIARSIKEVIKLRIISSR